MLPPSSTSPGATDSISSLRGHKSRNAIVRLTVLILRPAIENPIRDAHLAAARF